MGIKHDLVLAGYEPMVYSGRGMMGRKCLGVAIDNNAALWELGQSLADEGCLCDAPRTDSFGQGLVAYWPNVDP